MFARLLVAVALSLPLPALAQNDAMQAMHHQMMTGMQSTGIPTEPGQSAFAAIQEIVGLLEADPSTDWSKVDIEALRGHLVDMDNVTLHAQVVAESVAGGMRFVVTGPAGVSNSIRRMVIAHAATMDGTGGWRITAAERPGGAALTITSALPADATKIRALGFIGVMTRGMHHQQHHIMIARGQAPHA